MSRWYAKKYGLTYDEARALAWLIENDDQLEARIEDWRSKHGYPAADSPLARGIVVDIIKREIGREARVMTVDIGRFEVASIDDHGRVRVQWFDHENVYPAPKCVDDDDCEDGFDGGRRSDSDGRL